MKRTKTHEMAWLALDWQRPFELEEVYAMLNHLAAQTPPVNIIFEARGYQGQVKYYFGADRKYMRVLTDVMKAHGDIRFAEVPYGERKAVSFASQLKITKPSLALNTEITEAVVRAGLAALAHTKNDAQSVVQIVLGQPYAPRPMPSHLPDPHASWITRVLGDVEQATAESRSAVKEKLSCSSFATAVRLGSTGNRDTVEGNILSIWSALRTMRSAGVAIQAAKDNPDKLNSGHIPWSFPLRLNVKELACFLLLPSGETMLPGVKQLHPKQIMPPTWYRNPAKMYSRVFAHSLDGRSKLSISPEDSKTHTVLIGPTGVGKSTAMQHLILSDIYAGRSVLVIDPKADLVNNILARIPKHREEDVIIIDPSSDCPVGLNLLAYKNHNNPNLIADTILAIFMQIFKDNFGIRSLDVISHSLLTLAKCKNSSLLWLPVMLSDEGFRRKITADIKDKVGLEPFWAAFNAMSDNARKVEIAPVMNKLRQFLLRPGLRNVLGQSNPKFDMTELFTKRRIVLVPLNAGIIGASSSRLIGSLIVGLVWALSLSRTSIPEEKRHTVSVFIDELQDYISSISSDFSDALAQARGLGVGFTMAHQYREQLSPEIRAGVDANARNKICFGVNATDAKAMAAMAPELEPEDFMALPQYHIYTSFSDNGRNTGWISAKTVPMSPALRSEKALKRKIAERYGKPGAETEREYLELLAGFGASNAPDDATGPVGRRAKK